MDQIQAMKIFIRIAELGSFTLAAEDLNLPRATVSTILKRLEQRLGVRLFLRTTRQVKITEEGERYYQRCLQLIDALEEADNLFVGQKKQPEGKVRINMPHSIARHMVIPALPAFSVRYPQIQLLLGANDNAVDLLHQGVDCVLRAWPSEDENLQSRLVAQLPQRTYASPAYLDKHGTPNNLEQLASHFVVGYFFANQQPDYQLEFQLGDNIQRITLPTRLTVSGADAYVAAGKAGFGIIQVSSLSCQEAVEKGELIEILTDIPPRPMPLYLMYPPGRFLAPRIRVLLDWLIELFDRQLPSLRH